MDPIAAITALANAAEAAITLGAKIWDATPKDLQAQTAGDWAKSWHNVSAVLLGIQDRINAALLPPKS